MRLARFLRIPAAVWIFLFMAGCAGRTFPPVDLSDIAGIELSETPFYPQQKYQCGPSALAVLLQSSGVHILPEQITPKLYLPGKQGSLQLEIVAAIRSHNRVAYRIPPTLPGLFAELHERHPVLVLQNIGLNVAPAYHYAVVIGFEQPDKIILRSGTTKRLLMDLPSFWHSWETAGKWGVIALHPEELPANPDSRTYIESLIPFETLGKADIAEAGYRAFIKEYPKNITARFGLANSLAAQDRLEEASRVYLRLIGQHPDFAPAVNNLAEVLSRRHCSQAAIRLIDTFLARLEDVSEYPDFLLSTKQEIRARDKNEHENSLMCDESIEDIDGM